MPVIKPVSYLRNNFKEISDMVHSSDEPVYLTKNGSGDMVVMSIEHYEKQLARLELYQLLDDAREEIENGAAGKNAKQIIKTMMD